MCTKASEEEIKNSSNEDKGQQKLQPMMRMEDYRIMKRYEMGMDKLLKGLMSNMAENHQDLIRNLKLILKEDKNDTILTKPKNQPT